MSKDLVNALGHRASVDPKTASNVLDALHALAVESLRTTGTFEWPGLVQFDVVRTPALPTVEGINPFTKSPVVFRGKPAKTEVRTVAASALKQTLGATDDEVAAAGSNQGDASASGADAHPANAEMRKRPVHSHADLVEALLQRVGTQQTDPGTFLKAFAGVLTEALQEVGTFTWPDIVEMNVAQTPATAERPGINPFTKEPIVLAAKPASIRTRAKLAPALEMALGLAPRDTAGVDS
jgi:nucleoid DNA-binding protein